MTVDEVKKSTEDEGRRRRRRSRQVEAEKPVVQMAPGQTARKDRPTPSRREDEKQPNAIMRVLNRVREYWQDTRSELKKVTWPSREEAVRLAGIVLGVTAISAIALGLLDFLFTELFTLGFASPVVFVIFAVVLVAGIALTFFMVRRRSSYER